MSPRTATRVELDTSFGRIALAVFDGRAPHSALAFLKLVKDGSLARAGTFYRAVRSRDNDPVVPPIDVLQGGLLYPPQALSGVPHESRAITGLRHIDGTISLTRGPVGSATGAGFFICIGGQPALDLGGERNRDQQGFAAFGVVASGMDAVRTIHELPTGSDASDPFPGQMLVPPIPIRQACIIS